MIEIDGNDEWWLTTASKLKDYPTSKFWLGTSGKGTRAISGSYECRIRHNRFASRNINVNWIWKDKIDARRGFGAGFSVKENIVLALERTAFIDVPFDIEVDFNDTRN